MLKQLRSERTELCFNATEGWIRCGRNYQPWGHLRLLKGCQGVGGLWLEAWPGQLGMD
jgi:hypothetical protein